MTKWQVNKVLFLECMPELAVTVVTQVAHQQALQRELKPQQIKEA